MFRSPLSLSSVLLRKELCQSVMSAGATHVPSYPVLPAETCSQMTHLGLLLECDATADMI